MEWSYVLGTVVILIGLTLSLWPRRPAKSVADALIDEQESHETESEEQSFDATDLEYEANEPERPTGVTDDGWLSIYTMTSGQWYGHTLFQTLTSYGFQLDEQQCMSIRVGDSVIRVMRATQPMTFDIDLLAQQTCNGLVWIIDTETTDALQAIVKLRELTANFAMDMRATIVAKDKQELQQDWFDLVSAYIEARQLETV